jgi:hypothetical protein
MKLAMLLMAITVIGLGLLNLSRGYRTEAYIALLAFAVLTEAYVNERKERSQ